MLDSGLNLLSAALGFDMTTVFVAFVCARFICCRARTADDRAPLPLDFEADFPADLDRPTEHTHCGLEPLVAAAIPTMKYNCEAFHSKDDAQSRRPAQCAGSHWRSCLAEKLSSQLHIASLNSLPSLRILLIQHPNGSSLTEANRIVQAHKNQWKWLLKSHNKYNMGLLWKRTMQEYEINFPVSCPSLHCCSIRMGSELYAASLQVTFNISCTFRICRLACYVIGHQRS